MTAIKAQMQKGMKWTGISTVIITVIQIVQFAYLGKQMSLAEFGLVGMMTTIIIFAQILLDFGIGSAIIQKENISKTMFSTLFWLNMMIGMVLFLLLYVGSPIIAGFFQQDELVELIRIMAFMFLIAPIGQQFQYMMQKELQFQVLGMIETAVTLISFISLVILFCFVSPIYAYVISQLVFYGGKGILYFVVYQHKWRPTFVFKLSECKDILSFGFYQLLSRLVNRIGANIDLILIGRFMGAEALGIYHLAYQIVTIPVLKINPIVTRVAFPVFAKNQHSNSVLNEGFLHMTKILSFISFPLLVGLIAVADEFILFVFGEKWTAAVPILQIMAIVGILRVLMNPNGSIILAKGKANIAFYWDAVVLLLYGGSLLIAVTTNQLEIVAWTYVIVSILNFIFGRWLLAWLIQLEWSRYLKTIVVPFVLSVVIAIFAYVIKEMMAAVIPNPAYWPLIISVSSSACLYMLLLSILYPAHLTKFAKRRIRGRSI
ncbi:teichuronic acid biosynthesis protein TuaB [Bacillus sp. PS06]|uniref:teichuronic acid biosynthesis protein TuaB n=1 Tax=Bacillus sp. PS06 TaxID=2764176 RepID=UPI00177FED7D|nr:MOP flippase family protein [Bacillus sp. PS06]MBD8070889.1 MOP flippase family protein [Bacillus sp. PS06]